MLRFDRVWPGAAILWTLLACGLLTGCDLWHRTNPDERREANFMAAYNYSLQGSYEEAAAAYYRALEANPNNATAHLDLGFLYQDKLHDYVLSIYHFRRCQQIKRRRHDRDAEDPTIENAVRQAQIQLAIQFASAFGHQQTQTQVDDLKRRNAELEATIKELKMHLGQAAQNQETGNGSAADPSAGSPGVVSRPQPNPVGAVTAKETKVPTTPKDSGSRTPPTSRSESTATTPKVHVVKSGETLALIARKYGLNVQQLQSANRSVDPRRLKPGQSLVIPDRH